jgi:hypothetical protein
MTMPPKSTATAAAFPACEPDLHAPTDFKHSTSIQLIQPKISCVTSPSLTQEQTEGPQSINPAAIVVNNVVELKTAARPPSSKRKSHRSNQGKRIKQLTVKKSPVKVGRLKTTTRPWFSLDGTHFEYSGGSAPDDDVALIENGDIFHPSSTDHSAESALTCPIGTDTVPGGAKFDGAVTGAHGHKRLTLQQIIQVAHLSIRKAASTYGMSATHFKSWKKKLGIKKWSSRQITAISIKRGLTDSAQFADAFPEELWWMITAEPGNCGGFKQNRKKDCKQRKQR